MNTYCLTLLRGATCLAYRIWLVNARIPKLSGNPWLLNNQNSKSQIQLHNFWLLTEYIIWPHSSLAGERLQSYIASLP